MKLLIYVLLIATITGCSKDDKADVLMSNGSFELNGSFTDDDWLVIGGSSSSDAPTDGGNFSLRLDPQVFPDEGYAEYVISGLTGVQNLTISAYIKAFGDWPSSITVSKLTADNVTTVLATTSSNAAEWTESSVSISSQFEEGDELLIKLSAGTTETPVSIQYVLFDLITVQQN